MNPHTIPDYWEVLEDLGYPVFHPWAKVHELMVHFPNGLTQLRTVHEDGSDGGCGAVAVTDSGEVIMIEQNHFASSLLHTYTFPGGGLHKGKTALESAQEELLEETGLVAERWEPIFLGYRFPTFSTGTHQLFFARGLREATPEELAKIPQDLNEIITAIHRVPMQEAFGMVGTKVHDFMAIAGLQWLQIQQLKGKIPALLT